MKVRIIRDDCGAPYLVRLTFFTIKGISLKLHVILKSDEDRALHDHPWWFVTCILCNGYKDHTPEGVHERKPGNIVFHSAKFTHRVELRDNIPAVTLVLTGVKTREWGFFTKAGWVEWFKFNSGRDC